jgi:hypothetical protein
VILGDLELSLMLPAPPRPWDAMCEVVILTCLVVVRAAEPCGENAKCWLRKAGLRQEQESCCG